MSRQRSVPHPHTFGGYDDHDDKEDGEDDNHDYKDDGDDDDHDDERTTTMMTTLTTTRGRVVRELSTDQLGCRPRLQTEVLQMKYHHHHQTKYNIIIILITLPPNWGQVGKIFRFFVKLWQW